MTIRKSCFSQPGYSQWLLIGLTLITAWLIVANQLLPTNSPFHVGNQSVILMSKYLCYAMLAVSLDLVWGYLGILSLGHGLFFALGGYVMGMYLTLQTDAAIGPHEAALPNFASLLNWRELPWYWLPANSFVSTLLLIVAVPGVLAFIFGYMTFRSRVTGVYLSIMTQALTVAFMLAFQRNEFGFGGDNGLTHFKYLLGVSLTDDRMRCILLAVTLIALLLTYYVCRRLLGSKLGRATIATRDAENRLRFLGYRVEKIKLAIFVLSALLAGLAGALYVPQVGIITPNEFLPLNSIEIVVWVAIGGRATLYGAIIGALLVNYVKSLLTVWWPDGWLLLLGLLFVLVPIALPNGLMGLKRLSWRGKKPPQRHLSKEVTQ